MQVGPFAHLVQLDAFDAIAVLLLEDAVIGLIVSTHMRSHHMLQLIPVALRCSIGASSSQWVPENLIALQAL